MRVERGEKKRSGRNRRGLSTARSQVRSQARVSARQGWRLQDDDDAGLASCSSGWECRRSGALQDGRNRRRGSKAGLWCAVRCGAGGAATTRRDAIARSMPLDCSGSVQAADRRTVGEVCCLTDWLFTGGSGVRPRQNGSLINWKSGLRDRLGQCCYLAKKGSGGKSMPSRVFESRAAGEQQRQRKDWGHSLHTRILGSGKAEC